MKKRWLLNLLLLVLVVGLATFLHLRPKQDTISEAKYEVSSIKLADLDAIKVDFPTQAPVSFERVDGLWRMTAPYKTRADQESVNRIAAVVAATSKEKFPATELGKYGLDSPQLKLRLVGKEGNYEFLFGTYNPVTEQQYMLYKDAIYLVTGNYSEAARTQPIEMIDKSPLTPAEVKLVAGFDFSRLEQWIETRMNLDMHEDKWETNLSKAHITQNEMNEWVDISWKQARAKAVELYTPNHKETYPSFDVKLKDGKKVHFDKISEAPELLLGRPDEGILYHFPNDVGFNMLNPPLNLK
jgi:hypothetical protein